MALVSKSSVTGKFSLEVLEVCKQGQLKEALDILCSQDLAANLDVYAFLLQCCGKNKALSDGKRLHQNVKRYGLGKEILLGNRLIEMYRRCGDAESAAKVFDEMPSRSIGSWTSMIAAFGEHDYVRDSLQIFLEFQLHHLDPDEVLFTTILKLCTTPTLLPVGRLVHSDIISRGLDYEVTVGNSLINMYGKCGSLEDGCRLFDNMPQRDLVSWNSLMATYARHNHDKEALQLFWMMQIRGIKPDDITFLNVLNACHCPATITNGKVIHAVIINNRLEANIVIMTSLINMYGKCGYVQHASLTFGNMHQANIISWTAAIAAYAQNGYNKEALQLFREMLRKGMKPNNISFITTLNACFISSALAEGKLIHMHAIIARLEMDMLVGNALINMYGKCASLEVALQVFYRMQERSVVSWTAIIAAYVQSGDSWGAMKVLRLMQLEGILLNKVTFITALTLFSSLEYVAEIKRIHSCIIDSRLGEDLFLGTALVDAYGRCRRLEDALKFFEKMHDKTIITWNAMIGAYSQHGHGVAALHLFEKMSEEGMRPDQITFVNLLDACADLFAVMEGRVLHSYMFDNDLQPDTLVSNALLNMYSKCGCLADAKQTFEKISERDLTLWNMMVTAFVQHGYGDEAVNVFVQMQEFVQPNKVTLIDILSACSIAGLVDEAHMHFVSMSNTFGVTLSIEHYGCIVDLLGKLGHLDELEDLVGEMVIQPDNVIWMSFLAACKIHGDIERINHLADHIAETIK